MWQVLDIRLSHWFNPSKRNNTQAILLVLEANPPSTELVVKPCMNRVHKIWWCCILRKVQFFVIIPLRNNVRQEIASYIQIALDIHCALYTLYGLACIYGSVHAHSHIQVSQEECKILRESVP